jgi:uroporphyrinogen-III synthase
MTTRLPLEGRTIAVPETRELDVFADLLTRRGAAVLRCPLVSILDAPDSGPVLAWIERFNGGACDDLILLTGEGLRRLMSCIEQHQPALREPFVTQLAKVRKITRGPKPARALRELGLKPDLAGEEPTTQGVIAKLREFNLRRRRVGVQLYGTDPNPPLMEFLTQAGADISIVAPYVYADAAADADVIALIDRMAGGTVHAIAFTSKAQVERLFNVARKSGREAELMQALARTLVAAVGPVVRDELAARGVKIALMPQDSYFLKPLTNLLVEHLQ